ncbi:MAG: hypothetical protein R3B95_10205 [Nitrospirales bacterium]|nr:hypothetical protein [Nitrospirales bacterium]
MLVVKNPKVDPRLQPFDELVELGATDVDPYGDYSIDLRQNFEDYWASRSKNLRRQLRKTMESIAAEDVQISVEFNTDWATISDADCSAWPAESLGWKGAAGTAIHGNNPTGNSISNF